MRILEIVSARDINGAVSHVLQLMEQFERRGHEAYLLCPPDAWIANQVRPDCVIRSSLQRWPLRESRRVAAIARERGIQVTHTHQSRAHSFGVLLRWLHGIPSVATAHNCRIQLHWALNNQVIGVSAPTTRFQRRWNAVSRRRSQTIENFVDPGPFSRSPSSRQRLRSQWGWADEQTVGVVVGAVAEKKGLHVLLESLREVVRAAPDFHLAVVGTPRGRDLEYAETLHRQAAKLGVERHITWAGSRQDIPDVLGASDLFISSSLEENFPISMLEAMASGLAVVGTRVGGVPDCVEHGATGLLVEPGDPSMLAAALSSLVLDPPARGRLGDAGRRRVAKCFSAESQMPKIEAVLARAAGVADVPDPTASAA